MCFILATSSDPAHSLTHSFSYPVIVANRLRSSPHHPVFASRCVADMMSYSSIQSPSRPLGTRPAAGSWMLFTSTPPAFATPLAFWSVWTLYFITLVRTLCSIIHNLGVVLGPICCAYIPFHVCSFFCCASLCSSSTWPPSSPPGCFPPHPAILLPHSALGFCRFPVGYSHVAVHFPPLPFFRRLSQTVAQIAVCPSPTRWFVRVLYWDCHSEPPLETIHLRV
ncbi:hypothetical protein BV22DRAFT_809182 [Leucogyrophana mollusca]|uniref:Uncharacterized protein n=1 Tax=Leucogyrophana mollusca TaxID=85980 RepID=A0ACB8B3S0_9AGAM|nr:hypothetical protein BV22DRAFT_809182 [Leucogyrophana mollusca]